MSRPTGPYPTRYPTLGKPPRAAAAVILVREGPPVEVYMVKRSPKLRFLGGFGGYPGGRVDQQDADLGGVEDRLDGPATEIAAVRELFEEAGILVADGAEGLEGEALDRERQLLLDGAPFEEVCQRLGVTPSPPVDALRPAGRWVTPYYSPLRYDTIYYLHVLRGSREPSVWPGELAEGWWSEPAKVLEDWRAARIWLAPPVTESLRVLARGIDPLDTLLPRLDRVSTDRGHPFHPVRLRYGIRLLPLLSRTLPPANFTNTWFIGEQELLVVDPGAAPGEGRELLFRAVEMLLNQGRRLRATVLTHHHLDHVDSAVALRERFGVPIIAHPLAAQALQEARRAPYRPELEAFEVDEQVEDGHLFDLEGGFQVQVLHTPGHTRGHICLWEKKSGSLLAGDLVSGLSPVIIDPPEGNMEQYLASLQRMIDLGGLGLFPGHGPPATSSADRIALLLKHRLWRQERVRTALQEAPAGLTFDELVPLVYDDVPLLIHAFAARSLLAHLEKMLGDGEILETAGRYTLGSSSS